MSSVTIRKSAVPFLFVLTLQGDRISETIEPVLRGPPTLAVGDSVALSIRRYHCYGDVCDIINAAVPGSRWRSSAPHVVSVDSRGVLRGRRPGEATISAWVGVHRLTTQAYVFKPVRSLEWSYKPKIPKVGDTLIVAVIARDSARRIVARLVPYGHVTGTDWSGEVLWPSGYVGNTRVVINRPGLLVLVARLAHRADTLRLRVLR